MSDLKWTASIDVTNVSKAITKIEKEAESLGVSFDKSFKTAEEGISYFKESISSLESALVKLKKEQADIMSLPQSEERTARLKELKDEIDDVTNSLRQSKKWQTELSKAQREDLGNTQAQTSSFRGLFNTFKAGAKTTHSLTGGIMALSAAMKANPVGLVLLAVASLVKIFKGLYNTIQPLKNLVDGITDSFKKAYTAVVNFFGAETVSQHDARIKQIEDEKKKLDDLKDSVKELNKENEKRLDSKKTPQERKSELEAEKKSLEQQLENLRKSKPKTEQWKQYQQTNIEGTEALLKKNALDLDEVTEEINKIEKKAAEDKQSAIEKYKQQLAQQLELQKSFGKRLAESIEDAEQKRTLAGINAMNDGFAKRLALLKFNNEKENKSIEKYEKEQIEAYNKAYKTNYTSLDQLPEETRSNIASIVSNRKASNEQSYTSAVEKEYQSVIDKYQSFTVQIKSINDKYEEEEKALRDKNTAESLASIEILKQKREEELESVYLSQREYSKKNNDVLKKAFGNTAITTKKQLEEAIGIVEKYRQILGADNEEDALKIGRALGLSDEDTNNVIANGAQIEDEIQEIDEKLNDLKSKRTGLKKIADDFKALANSSKDGGLDFQENLDTLLDDISPVIDALGSMAAKMQEIAELSDNNKLQTYADGISTISKLYNSASTGFKIGGGIGAVVGFGFGAINEVIDSRIEQQKAAKELRDTYAEIGEEIEHNIYLENVWKDTSSIFGKSVVNSISDSIDNIASANEKMTEKLAQIQEAYRNQYKYMYDSIKDYNQKFFANETAYYKNLYEKYSNDTLSIQELLQGVKLKGGKKIEDFDIYNADGSVNLSALESLIPEISEASNEKNLDNLREFFTSYIEYAKDAEAATEELNNAYESLFGGLSNSLADDLINAFASGTDAGIDMSKTVSNYFKKYFVESISNDITQILEKYGKDLEEAINSGNEEEINSVKQRIDSETNAIIESQQKRLDFLKINGYLDSEASSSTAKGIAQASQDSVDELNGRFTAIQSHTYSINESIKDMQSRQATILNEIMGIHRDTSSIDGRLRDGISVRLLR